MKPVIPDFRVLVRARAGTVAAYTTPRARPVVHPAWPPRSTLWKARVFHNSSGWQRPRWSTGLARALAWTPSRSGGRRSSWRLPRRPRLAVGVRLLSSRLSGRQVSLHSTLKSTQPSFRVGIPTFRVSRLRLLSRHRSVHNVSWMQRRPQRHLQAPLRVSQLCLRSRRRRPLGVLFSGNRVRACGWVDAR